MNKFSFYFQKRIHIQLTPFQLVIMLYQFVNKKENALNYSKILRHIVKYGKIDVLWMIGKKNDFNFIFLST